MKTTGRVAAIFFLLLAWTLPAYSGESPELGEGAWLVDGWQTYKRDNRNSADERVKAAFFGGYIVGVVNVQSALDVVSIPDNVRVSQVVAIVGKYLEEHPEKWNERAVVLVATALKEAFPPSEEASK